MPTRTRLSFVAILLGLAIAGCTDQGSAEPDTSVAEDIAIDAPDAVDASYAADTRALTRPISVSERPCTITEGAIFCWGGHRWSDPIDLVEQKAPLFGEYVPTRVPGVSGAVAVAVGGNGDRACAILGGGAVWCWTNGTPAPIGSTTPNGSTPPPV